MEYDLELGRLENDVLITHVQAVEGVEEQGHYETIKEYPNGGKDVEWVVDVPAVKAVEEHDETEDIMIYVPFSESEIAENKARDKHQKLKDYLDDTDKYSIKCNETGVAFNEVYPDVFQNRLNARAKINEIENTYPHFKNEKPAYPNV